MAEEPLTQGTTSIGAYWWMQVSGSRSARNSAEVTVTVVTRQVELGPRLLQPAQQLDQRRRLADARGVEPGELSVRPRPPGLAHALAEPRAVLLALGAPPLQRPAREGRRPPRDGQVEAQQQGPGRGVRGIGGSSASAELFGRRPPPAPRRSAGAGGR